MNLNYVDAILALPSPREVVDQLSIDAKKSFGQNFIFDSNITNKIVRLSGVNIDDTVIEIGPGPGCLTRSLLIAGAYVHAIEMDQRMVNALHSLGIASEGRLQIQSNDALKIKISSVIPAPQRFKIIANLPYNIATELLMRWLDDMDRCDSLTLMYQKEVADRMIAHPGDSAYSRLSIMTQFRFDVDVLFDLPPSVFVPPPKVDSSVVYLRPKTTGYNAQLRNDLEKVTAMAFGQRRKMLRSSLKPLLEKAPGTLEKYGINPTARAEDLSLDDYIHLAETFRSCSSVL